MQHPEGAPTRLRPSPSHHLLVSQPNCSVSSPYQERHAQVSKLKPAGVIDVSDLPDSLPRQEVKSFAWSEDGFQVTLTISLAEPVRKPQVPDLPCCCCCWRCVSQC